jgi:hypothetical protein
MSDENQKQVNQYLKMIIQVMQIITMPFLIYVGNSIVELKESVATLATKMEVIQEMKSDLNNLKEDQKSRARDINLFFETYAPALQWAKKESQK